MENLNESRFRWQYRFLDDHLHHGAVRGILDLGCGDGELLLFLAKLFPKARITGVDAYNEYTGSGERRVRAANRISESALAGRCRIVEADILERPFPADSFDLVHARNVLHHLFERAAGETESRIISFFEYLRTLLNPDGYIVISEIGPVNCLQYLKYLVPRRLVFINQAHNMDYRSKFPLQIWLDCLRAAGLECLHSEYYVPYRLRRFSRFLNNEFASRFSNSAYSLLAIRKTVGRSSR